MIFNIDIYIAAAWVLRLLGVSKEDPGCQLTLFDLKVNIFNRV